MNFAVRHPLLGWPDEGGGFFVLDGPTRRRLCVQASNGGGWEHVSVSLEGLRRCPNWDEMCFVKSIFWEAEDCVVQFHPPESQYVNNAEVLHLWRKIGFEFPTPPTLLVGVK